ncbi:hypothetical protein CYLTODRAFT_459984 [Cylindrobasidium torrendii FP15055 ss-10]|uniref:Ubiquitin-like protease family profile domain-containing protein n=1 Tax=Cylindrobasidium torrendii FP15055 ss-10 TaxID=1314674 RepID=A0A0D7ASG0_9AGAR|nr:hypothetical protein CYLTODRAFT_459984 [Cylindrobasidium torrendii FP15055 ss-10]
MDSQIDEINYSDEEIAVLAHGFVSEDWIGVGRSFDHRNGVVQAAFARHMQVPARLSNSVPTLAISPSAAAAAFVSGHWSCVDAPFDNVESHAFLDHPPNLDLEVHDILEIRVPSVHVLQLLHGYAGQAWLDGRQSVRVWHDGQNTWLLCPFWILTAMSNIHQIRLSGWAEGWAWINRVEITATAAGRILCNLARRYMQLLPACVGPADENDLTYQKLALLLGHHDLDGSVLDNLLHISWASLPESRQERIIFANTLFSQSLAEGAHRYPSSLGGQVLRHYGALLQGTPHCELLLFPINIGNFHWTSGKIDIQARVIHYGDSLLPHGSGHPPDPLRPNLVEWLQRVLPGGEFVWQTDLQCPTQRDGWNCALITANILAHEGIGARLWDMALGDELRLYGFCKLCENLLIPGPERSNDPFSSRLESPSFTRVSAQLLGQAAEADEAAEAVVSDELQHTHDALPLLCPQENNEDSVPSSNNSDSNCVERRTYSHPRLEFAIDRSGGLLVPVNPPS